MMRLAMIVTAVIGCSSSSKPAPAAPEPMHAEVGSAAAAAPPDAAPAKPVEPAADPEKAKADLVAAETAAHDRAKPAFDKYCASCHTKTGKKATPKKLGHFDMTAYPFTGEHARSIGNEIRVVLGIDGTKKASMPDDKPGSVKGDDLALIKAWTEAWQAAGAAGAHPADPADKDDD